MKDTAVLLLHGYSGAPFEMEFLADGLRQRGLPAFIPTLPGHDTTFADFQSTRFPDWLQKSEETFLKLRKEFSRVVLLGFSMGGTLALSIGAKFDPAAIVCVAAPICLQPWKFWRGTDRRLPFLSLLRWVTPVLTTRPPRPASRAIAPWKGYEGQIALHPLHSLICGLRRTRKQLGDIQAPLLVLHGKRDRLVHPDNAWWILRESGSRLKRLELIYLAETLTSGHTLTTHRECKQVLLERCFSFFQEALRDESVI